MHGEWRIHFHVPIYLECFGHLTSTREQIEDCMTAARRYSDVTHFEVETYAWGVLPADLKQADLAAGIAQELTWFRSNWQAIQLDQFIKRESSQPQTGWA